MLKKVLLLRQVNDFALATPNEALAKLIYDRIGKKLQLPSEEDVPFKYLGLLEDFNGLNVKQYRDCTVVSCEAYIDRVLKTHGWDTPISESTKPTAPLPVDCINRIYKDVGQPENSKEHYDLVDKHGFKYRQLLGELLCAHVTCRPDIGCAVITLSKFSTCPADIHFTMLKKVAKYLRATKSWGIVYQRSSVDPSLPPRPDFGDLR